MAKLSKVIAFGRVVYRVNAAPMFRAPKDSIAVDDTNEAVYINADGVTNWQDISWIWSVGGGGGIATEAFTLRYPAGQNPNDHGKITFANLSSSPYTVAANRIELITNICSTATSILQINGKTVAQGQAMAHSWSPWGLYNPLYMKAGDVLSCSDDVLTGQGIRHNTWSGTITPWTKDTLLTTPYTPAGHAVLGNVFNSAQPAGWVKVVSVKIIYGYSNQGYQTNHMGLRLPVSLGGTLDASHDTTVCNGYDYAP